MCWRHSNLGEQLVPPILKSFPFSRLVLAAVALLLPCPSAAAAGLLITEIYANAPGSGRDSGKEWIELYNPAEQPVPLRGTRLCRLDGTKQEQAWCIDIAASETEVPAKGYAVVAQARDLGIEVCLDKPIHVVTDEAFSLKNSGVQFLCVHAGGVERCVKFSDSKSFPDGKSRHLVALDREGMDLGEDWIEESCMLADSVFGTPGFALGACGGQTDDPWYAAWVCPITPPVLEGGGDDGAAAIGGDGDADWTETQARREQVGKQLEDTLSKPLPSLVLVDVALNARQGTVRYEVEQGKFNELTEVSLYAAGSPDSRSGILLARAVPLPSRTDQPLELAWSAQTLPPGRAFLFARVRDVRGRTAYAHASKSVDVKADQTLPRVRVVQARLHEAVAGHQALELQWRVESPRAGALTLQWRTSGESVGEWQSIVTALPVDQDHQEGTYLWRREAPSHNVPLEVAAALHTESGTVRSDTVAVEPAPESGGCGGSPVPRTQEADAVAALVLLLAARGLSRGATRFLSFG
ncbi:MAG: hypothetical protein AAF471_02695 [Myxococcota bacterium]